MTQIPNPTHVPLEVLLSGLERRYPGVKIRKPFLGIGPRFLQVPVENFKMIIRDHVKQGKLSIDFNPPPLWTFLGAFGIAFVVSLVFSLLAGQLIVGAGALIILLGIFLAKSIFRARHKARFTAFEAEVRSAMHPDKDSIF